MSVLDRTRSLLVPLMRRLRPLVGSMRRRVRLLSGRVRSLLAGVATRGGGASPEPTTTTTTVPTTTTTVPTTTTTTAPPPVAPLTGVPGEFPRPALIVKIDNVSAARPQSGLRQADIVI